MKHRTITLKLIARASVALLVVVIAGVLLGLAGTRSHANYDSPLAPSVANDPVPALTDSGAPVAPMIEAPPKPELSRAADSPLQDIEISFKLDPRLTKSLYMGDRWVSPPTYTKVGEGPECSVEVKVRGVGAQGKAMEISPRWTSANPNVAIIAPDEGKEVKIIVNRPGQTTIQVAALGLIKKLALTAVAHGDTLLIELTQPAVQSITRAQPAVNEQLTVASAGSAQSDSSVLAERQATRVHTKRGHHRRPLQAVPTSDNATAVPDNTGDEQTDQK
jgi:hypothetical protein